MPADRALLQRVAQAMFAEADEVEHLGTGGFASTFRVALGEEIFALKVIDPDVAEVGRVARELDALRRVDHPNVVKYLDHGEEAFEGRAYAWLKMSYVAGRTLRETLASGDAPPLQIKLSLLAQAVAGAAAIWQAGTAHRDLTPNNLMVTDDQRLVIVDLGMARHVDDVTLTVLPTPGTPGWMAPEQVGATPTHGDWRSDQYVLGLVAFSLLTERVPFNAPNVMALWEAPAHNTVPSVRSIDPTLAESLSNLVDRMVARQPHRRFLRPDVLVSAIQEAALLNPEPPPPPAAFFLLIGHLRGYCSDAFLGRLAADGVVVQMRAHDSTADFARCVATTPSELVLDPMTQLARSPADVRLENYNDRTYGAPHLTARFASDEDRTAWCTQVLDAQLVYRPSVLMAPYFYASDGEFDWVVETLLCAATMRQLVADRAARGGAEALPIWTTVAVSSPWIAEEVARDRLLTAVTGESLDVLHLLVATTQLSFGPLRDLGVFAGFVDLLEVLGDAGVPVVMGQRASSGLLLLAMGAAGWTHGEESKLQNMSAPPQARERGGRALDRIYLPELLNSVDPVAFASFAARRGQAWPISTESGRELMRQNPLLEDLTSGQRVLLLRHNVEAQRAQAMDLSSLSAAGRRDLMLEWINEARRLWGTLPTPPQQSDTGGFLDTWVAALRL